MELTSLVEGAEKEGRIIPRSSFEEIFRVVVDRHLQEHISYTNLTGEEAKKDFENKYGGIAKRIYDECFPSGKAIFDKSLYSCGLFGVAEKVVLSLIDHFLEDVSKEKGSDLLHAELNFVRNYGFIARETFCEACSDSLSCVDYQTYVAGKGWRRYIPETIAVAGE